MKQVPLLCTCEIPVPGSMGRCIRILLHLNTEKPQSEVVHVYLRDAKRLRPDMSSASKRRKRFREGEAPAEPLSDRSSRGSARASPVFKRLGGSLARV